MNFLAVLMASAALLSACGQRDSYSLSAAHRATNGVPVLCLKRPAWNAYADSHGSPRTAAAVWDYRLRWIVVQESVCRPLVHWRTAPAWYVGQAVFVLAHEYRHSQQHSGNPPFSDADEADANCWASAHVHRFARRMGITRKLPSMRVADC